MTYHTYTLDDIIHRMMEQQNRVKCVLGEYLSFMDYDEISNTTDPIKNDIFRYLWSNPDIWNWNVILVFYLQEWMRSTHFDEMIVEFWISQLLGVIPEYESILRIYIKYIHCFLHKCNYSVFYTSEKVSIVDILNLLFCTTKITENNKDNDSFHPYLLMYCKFKLNIIDMHTFQKWIAENQKLIITVPQHEVLFSIPREENRNDLINFYESIDLTKFRTFILAHITSECFTYSENICKYFHKYDMRNCNFIYSKLKNRLCLDSNKTFKLNFVEKLNEKCKEKLLEDTLFFTILSDESDFDTHHNVEPIPFDQMISSMSEENISMYQNAQKCICLNKIMQKVNDVIDSQFISFFSQNNEQKWYDLFNEKKLSLDCILNIINIAQNRQQIKIRFSKSLFCDIIGDINIYTLLENRLTFIHENGYNESNSCNIIVNLYVWKLLLLFCFTNSHQKNDLFVLTENDVSKLNQIKIKYIHRKDMISRNQAFMCMHVIKSKFENVCMNNDTNQLDSEYQNDANKYLFVTWLHKNIQNPIFECGMKLNDDTDSIVLHEIPNNTNMVEKKSIFDEILANFPPLNKSQASKIYMLCKELRQQQQCMGKKCIKQVHSRKKYSSNDGFKKWRTYLIFYLRNLLRDYQILSYSMMNCRISQNDL